MADRFLDGDCYEVEPPCFCAPGATDPLGATAEFCPMHGDPGKPPPEPPAWIAEVKPQDLFGGHDFRYEESTDLFRCAICRVYEVTARAEDGPIKPCEGPASGEPMTLNAF